MSTDPVIIPKPIATGPFDSLREYLAAVEARGKLLRINKMDQDRFEASAFAYRMVEERGFDEAPPFMIEKSVSSDSVRKTMRSMASDEEPGSKLRLSGGRSCVANFSPPLFGGGRAARSQLVLRCTR